MKRKVDEKRSGRVLTIVLGTLIIVGLSETNTATFAQSADDTQDRVRRTQEDAPPEAARATSPAGREEDSHNY